jgi:hypothetical protein
MDEMGGTLPLTGEMTNSYKVFVGNSEGKRLLGRPKRRWEDNTRMNIREQRWEGVGWINLA